MAIKTDTFSSSGGGAGTDNLDDVTSRGATTTNAITVGGVTVGTEYSLPTLDGSVNQVLQTNGTGTVSFATLDFTGGLEYKGAFNATAGTPSLANAEKGDFYIIDTAGTIYGQTWAVGDHLLINEDMGGSITNSKIDKIDNTQAVTSVNTQTGAVVVSGNDILADHAAVHYTAANNNIDGHLSGIDSALGAVASPTLDDVTTNGDTTTNAINVGTITTSGDILADTADSRTIGAEDTRFITYFGDMNGAIRFKAKNDEGVQITKGQAVYIKGLAGDGTTPTVGLADADDATKMPAFGLAFNTANNSAEIQIVQVGNLGGLDTSGFSVGDTLYIDTTAGAVTKTKPTGESSQLQNIGRVIRSDNGDGVIMVGGAGRSAATPNLDQDKIFLGNASNQSVSTALSAIALSSFNDDLSYLSSGDNVSVLTNDAGYLTGITGESIGDLSDVTVTTPSNGQVLSYNGTNWVNSAASSGSLSGLSDTTIGTPTNGEVLKYNGTAWVDAQLAYSELSGTPTNVSTFTNDANYVVSGDNVSVLTNDAGYLTGITGESIGDLSDVTVTSAASGEVLKYNGSAWVDANVDYTEVTNTPSNVSTFTNDANYVASGDNVSTLTNDAGYLTGITGESLNDLSDVSFTAGAGIDGNVLTYDNTTGEWQAVAPASGGGSDFTAVTADVVRTDFAVTNYYTVLEESTQHSIYLPNYFEGDALGDFQNKRITVDNQGETTVRVLLRTSGTTANRLYASYEDLGSSNYNQNTVVISSITYAYIDIPAFTTYKLTCREHATVSYWFVEPFIMQFDNFSPANRDILVYNSTTEKYENSSDRSELIYSFQNSNFTAEVGYYYYVDSTAGDITVSLSTDATVVGKRFKIFKAKSANSVIITESNAINTIDPDDGAAGATSRSIQARSMIEFIAYTTSADYTYIITPQVEINDSDLNASGEFLIYDASVGAKQLITAPYTMPIADGSANQILKTDGSGSLDWVDQGSAPDVVTDSSGTNTTISTTTGIEEVHLISNGTNNVTITIPAASTAGEGYKYQVKRLGTGTVSVAPSSGTIDGAASFSLASQYDSVTVVSDNSNWFII